jgi:outer membrane immunogenic protein
MLKKSLLAGAVILLGAAAANAADVVDVAPVTDWTGFYVGLHGGYAWGDLDYSADFRDANLRLLDFEGDDTDIDGFFGGLQAGFNWQMDSILLGVEGDISLASIEADAEFRTDFIGDALRADTTVDWFGTARLRGGFLVTPDLLLYATGGLAWGSVDTSYDLDLDGVGIASNDESTTHLGWTLGGGAEFALSDNLSLKAEYLYVDLGEEEVFDDDIANIGNVHVDQDLSFHTVRAGLNFRF